MSDYERVRELARKAACLEGCVMAVFRKSDGTYGFGRENTDDIKGEILDYRYYE